MDNTNQEIYTLNTKEIFYAKNDRVTSFWNTVTLIVLIGSMVPGLFLKEYIFNVIPILYLFFSLAILQVLIRCKRKKCISAVDISFDSDCMKIHRQYVFTRFGKVKEEFHDFFYAPSLKITYDPKKHIIMFEGNVHTERYLYVPRSIEKRLEESVNHVGCCSFRLLDKNLDIVSVIQQHSPIRVHVLESGEDI